MALLELARRQTKIPVRSPALARNGPVPRPAAFWLLNNLGARDLVSGLPATIGGAAGDVTSIGVRGTRALHLIGTGTLDRVQLGSRASAVAIGANDFTGFVRFIYRTNASAYSAFGRWNTGADKTTCEWDLGASNTFSSTFASFAVAIGATSVTVDATVAWVAGREYTLIGRRRGTTIYVDQFDHDTKILVSASSTDAGITTINTAVSGRHTKLGEIDAGATYNLGADYIMAGVWPTAISDGAVRVLCTKPQTLFAGQAPRLWQIGAPDTTPPVITGPSGGAGSGTSSTSIPENTTAVFTFTADESVTWSLNGGADVARFTIDPSTGALSFLVAPDYEVPTDADTNNAYIVGVRATDGSSNASTQTVTVTVTDVAEGAGGRRAMLLGIG